MRTLRADAIKAIAAQRAEDFLWGMPESPEFSVTQRVMQEFQTHEKEEARSLASYQKIARATDDPLVGYLFNLIVADEERHREMIDRMVGKLRDELAVKRLQRPVAKGRGVGKKEKELLQVVERLLELERNWLKDHERLTKTSERLRHDVFALLFRTMVYDSFKHIGILDFLRSRLRRA